ncbi:uncharacterized protein LOC123322344 [Coccinella septempunctata]|uniref:uncharacterized protein LOC123322344 n=1 Tax=Coccinella septempunctata TaxID=41139 RepID=UPI001D06733E|nr:uncharacterized protein LOC123322344 [Coccinella septempunctata]
MNNFIDFKRKEAKARLIIKESKRTTWREFCSNINRSTPIKQIWKDIKNIKKSIQGLRHPLVLGNWSEEFLSAITPDSVYTQDEHIHSYDRASPEDLMCRPFTLEELERSLKNNPNTSPGLDNIQYIMLSHLPLNAKCMLLHIFNQIWETGEFPPQWKEYVVVPILQPNKDPKRADSHRPIALGSCVMKTFERILKFRLEWWMESKDMFPRIQFGFRKGHSTQDNVAALITDIYTANTHGEYLMAVFADVKKAYDNISLQDMRREIINIGLSNKFSKLVFNLYNNRKIFLRVGSTILGPRITSRGLPQGGILSPLLFVIVFHRLEKIFCPSLKILQYADDILLYVASKTFEECRNLLSVALNVFEKYLFLKGQELSQSKTVVCTFTKKTSFDPPELINLNNKIYSHVKSLKFLGITLDRKLLWRDHIDRLRLELNQSINILRSICHPKWGADQNISIMLYNNLIRSKIDYGCYFYGSASEIHLKKIDILQRKAIKICLGLLNCTTNEVVLSEAGELPLNFRRKFLTCKFLIKKDTSSPDFMKKLHQLYILTLTNRYWKIKKDPFLIKCYEELINTQDNTFKSSKLIIYSTDFDVLLQRVDTCLPNYKPGSEIVDFKLVMNNHFAGFYHIYTDASKLDNKVGCAIYDMTSGTSVKKSLCGSFSVYTAEMIAIEMALKYILSENSSIPSNNFAILSDSRSAIHSLRKMKLDSNFSHIHAEILKTLFSLRQINKNIYFVWVKAHVGIFGNEMVDKMAKEATLLPPLYDDKGTHTDMFPVIKRSCESLWSQTFRDIQKGKYYKNIEPTPLHKRWFQYSTRGRKFIRIMCRLRSGHGLSFQYLHKIGARESSLCDCGSEGTLEHMVLHCENDRHHHDNLMSKLSRHLSQLQPYSLGFLLGLKDEFVYNLLYEHICGMGLKI